jgi:hypothetical protein
MQEVSELPCLKSELFHEKEYKYILTS